MPGLMETDVAPLISHCRVDVSPVTIWAGSAVKLFMVGGFVCPIVTAAVLETEPAALEALRV